MKRIIILLSLFLHSFIINAQEKEVLNNQSIIDMVNMEFSEDIIIAKINSSDCFFSTSIDSLSSLKKHGVSNNIIVAMVNINKLQQEEQEAEENSISGIFYKENGKLKKIYPTSFSGNKTNTLGSAFSYGIASSKIKSTMTGSTSSNVIHSRVPEFYFLFDKHQPESTLSNWWFSVASSPNQFVLVQLTQKRKSRELETGKVNLYSGTSMGVSQDDVIQFKISEISEKEFLVTPNSILPPGEYCFFYQGIIPVGGYTNQSVFDFSISPDASSPAKYKKGDYVYVKMGDKVRKCIITHIMYSDGIVTYKGENTFGKKVSWDESSCSSNKDDL